MLNGFIPILLLIELALVVVNDDLQGRAQLIHDLVLVPDAIRIGANVCPIV